MTDTEFQPKWASPPGETIADLLTAKGVSMFELSKALDLTAHETTSLLAGIKPVTVETATRLSGNIGCSVEFWLRRESQFRADLNRMEPQARYDAAWLDAIPFRELVNLGWIRNCAAESDRAREALGFFGIDFAAQWNLKYPTSLLGGAFRASPAFDPRHEAVAAWLRRGEILATQIDCANWNPANFQDSLRDARRLVRNKDPGSFVPELRRLCAACGVALVVVRTPSGCHASGATQFLTRNKALLMLSFRYRSDDHFWFTFFHEAGHLLLHDVDRIFIDEEASDGGNDNFEIEANEFAECSLIPSIERNRMLRLRHDARDIIRFAHSVGSSAGVVVGQLQHARKLQHFEFNSLKRRYSEDDIDRAASL